MLDALQRALPAIAAHAAELDKAAAFPTDDLATLAAIGLPVAPLPIAMGGLGAGTDPAGTQTIFDLLRMLGQANLSLARLFEAHVNAVRLTLRYGEPHHIETMARHCRNGDIYGLWVTDAPGHLLRWSNGALHGSKGPCSGAGHLRHALVTIHDGSATGQAIRMALLDLTGNEPIDDWAPHLTGMRASANGAIGFDESPLPARSIFGENGDYLREPDFSTGAWRTMAATLGGMDALLDTVRTQFRVRGHDDMPLQQARFGAMLIARETARLFTWDAASIAEAGALPVPDQVAAVNLARIAVETACLDLIRDAQRALGLAAMLRPNPAERIIRDLSTYLRQPAPDLVLTEAAHHHLRA